MDRFALVCRARKGSSRTRGGLVAAAIAAVPRDPLRPNWALESSSSSSERTSRTRGTKESRALTLGVWGSFYGRGGGGTEQSHTCGQEHVAGMARSRHDRSWSRSSDIACGT